MTNQTPIFRLVKWKIFCTLSPFSSFQGPPAKKVRMPKKSGANQLSREFTKAKTRSWKRTLQKKYTDRHKLPWQKRYKKQFLSFWWLHQQSFFIFSTTLPLLENIIISESVVNISSNVVDLRPFDFLYSYIDIGYRVNKISYSSVTEALK